MNDTHTHEFHYRWEWQLQSTPEALWPFVSDTNRFNRDTGVPSLEQPADDERLPNARRHLKLYRLGMPVEWYEEPFEWVRPYRFGVKRRYVRGPVGEMRVAAQMTPMPSGGTRLVYEVWARPKNGLGYIAIPIQIGIIGARSFAATFRQYDRMAQPAKKTTPLIRTTEDAQFPAGGRERLMKTREELIAAGAQRELVDKLVDLIEYADDLTLAQLRPYVVADHWGVPRRAALELFLLATRVGMLEMRWWLLCPLCRGPRYRSSTLGDVQSTVHCETCNIDFTVNFDRSVELIFQPNPAIRQSEVREFCVAGPQVTPHVVMQQLLPAGAQREVMLPLQFGRHRLRAMELPGGQMLLVAPDGAGEVTLRASDDGWPSDEQRLAPNVKVRLENATAREQLFILERMAWTDQAATAAEVTTLQTFRDLFANEALRPGERISVGSLAILFTDLRESTKLYREVGDAVAFGYVMNHFDVLRKVIAEEDGALVKTIGDAVMAVFRRPVAALRAILRAQQILAAPPDGMQPLLLKAGIHYGTCVAVTLNDKLDYFGSTVNITARLEQLSSGGDVVISESVRHDPEVSAMLAEAQNRLRVEAFETTLKGYGDQRFELWRVMPSLATTEDVQTHSAELLAREPSPT